MKKYLLLALTGTLIVGCRPHDDGDNSSATGAGTPEIGAALAVQQTQSAVGTPFVGITVAELAALGAMEAIPATETGSLVASRDFSFPTSRKVSVGLDVAEARGMTTDVVFCTEYQALPGSYDVNYDSCLFQAEMHDGQLTTELDVVNQYDSLLGVVWFPQKGLEPLYREFWLK